MPGEAETYFHLAPISISPGSVIEPGNFGRIMRETQWKHGQYNREYALEQVRIDQFADLPSRLNCVFAFAELADAVSFKRFEPGFQRNLIYVVAPIDEAMPVFFAPIRLVDGWASNVKTDPDITARYWRNGHRSGQPAIVSDERMGELSESYEVLIASPCRVVSKIDIL